MPGCLFFPCQNGPSNWGWCNYRDSTSLQKNNSPISKNPPTVWVKLDINLAKLLDFNHKNQSKIFLLNKYFDVRQFYINAMASIFLYFHFTKAKLYWKESLKILFVFFVRGFQDYIAPTSLDMATCSSFMFAHFLLPTCKTQDTKWPSWFFT